MNYVLARYKANQREMIYRSYVCNSLQNAPQNKYITTSYDEMIKPKPKAEDADKLAADFIMRHKLKMEVTHEPVHDDSKADS